MLVLLRASLNLFLRRYRHNYREGRAGVIRLALVERAAAGWLRLLQFLVREADDLPFSPLRAALDKRPTPVYNTCALEMS